MKTILLTKGYSSIVDDSDFSRLLKVKWFARLNRGKVYAAMHQPLVNGKSSQLPMHRYLLNPNRIDEVDHINGDTLDNRRSNLRVCSRLENARNRKISSLNTTGFKGVSFIKHLNKFGAFISVKNKDIFLGSFKTAKEAHKAYCAAAIKYHGSFARFQ